MSSKQSEYVESLFKEIAEQEHERQDRINGMIAIPTATIGVICGVVSYYAEKAPDVQWATGQIDWVLTVFQSLFICLCLSVIATIFFLVRCLLGYKYEFVAHPTTLWDYIEGCRRSEISQGTTDPKVLLEKVDLHLRELMIEQYINAGQKNRYVNSTKAKFLHFANIGVVAAIIFAALSLLPFRHILNSRDQIQKVQLVQKG